jgi:hypothetical protein
MVKGLSNAHEALIEQFTSLNDMWQRAGVPVPALEAACRG